MTYAEPPGSWSFRNVAVASADVQIAASGTLSPERARRAARSRGVKIELFVSTRKRRSRSTSRCRNSAAPGRACSSRTRTPSISVSQHSAVDRTSSVSLVGALRLSDSAGLRSRGGCAPARAYPLGVKIFAVIDQYLLADLPWGVVDQPARSWRCGHI